MTPCTSQPPITPMHFINRCIWKIIGALHYNNHVGIIHWPYMLLFLLSKRNSAAKPMLFYYRNISILELIHVFVCSLQWRSKGGSPGGRGPRAALKGGRHFADQKLTFEMSWKVLVFRYYFKYIFKCSTAFQISCLEALVWQASLKEHDMWLWSEWIDRMFGGRRVFGDGPKFFKLCPIVLNYVQNIFSRGGEKFFCALYLWTCLLGVQLCPSPYTFLARQSHFSILSQKSFAQRKEMTFDGGLKTLGLQLCSVYIAVPLKIWQKKLHEITVKNQG